MTERQPDSTEAALMADTIARCCATFLAGELPEVQGAALAHLMATYLAGYIESDGSDPTAMREEILTLWLKTVRQLVGVMDAEQKAEVY